MVQSWRVLLGLVLIAGCAPTLTPRQEQVYAAVADCRERTGAEAFLKYVDLDGRFAIEPMDLRQLIPFRQCLRDRHRVRFAGDDGDGWRRPP